MRSEIAKIQAGYEQKLAELDILEETKRKYIEEDIERISEANRLEKEVEQIDAKIASIEAEKAELEKQKALQSTGSKDILAEIQDKNMLKEKADVVIDIIHRNKFTHTPAEIGEVLATQLGAVLSPIKEPTVEEVVVPVIEEQPTELVITSNEETTEPEVIDESNTIEYKPVFDVITDTSLDSTVPVSEVIEEVQPVDTITVASDNVEIIDTPEVEVEPTNLENTMINNNDLVSLLEEQAQPTEEVEDGKIKVTGEESVRVESQVIPEETDTSVLDLSVLFPGEVDSYSEQNFTPVEEIAPAIDSEAIPEESIPVIEEQPSQVESQNKVDNMIDFFDYILNPEMEQQEEGPRLGKVA